MHIDNIDLEHFPTNEVAQRLLTYVTRGWYDKSCRKMDIRGYWTGTGDCKQED